MRLPRLTGPLPSIRSMPGHGAAAAQCSHGLGRNAEAVASFDRALAIDPAYADAWKKRAAALGQMEKRS